MPKSPTWQTALDNFRAGLKLIDDSQATITTLRDQYTADIADALRQDTSIELDLEAIRATLQRPYTLLPINEQEAHLISWRGIKLPLFGWVVKHEPAFTIARVSRSMDLLTPFPAWVKDELGWKPPAHAALLDSHKTTVQVTAGDMDTFKHRYGAHLAKRIEGGYTIKTGAWIKLVSALIKDGILPYQPQPVTPEYWNPKADCPIVLRGYQEPILADFLAKGAVFINLPPGGGKTFIALKVFNHFKGSVLLLAPSVILLEQWAARIAHYAPHANVELSTYAGGKKHLDKKWDLVIFDEVQTLPADTFSKLAFLDTRYRIGLSASPWREDDRQHLIAALSGFPCAIRWADLIRAGVLQRPRIIVAEVPNDKAKIAHVKTLLAKRKAGRALIFCDYIEAGQQLADALGVPFVHGETPRKFEQVKAAEVCVVSRIADRGISFDDLTLVIEYAFLGGSREQEGQRFGRLLHSQQRGEHHLLFTTAEAQKYRSRIFGIEAELAGEVEIEFVTIGNSPAPQSVRTSAARPRQQRVTPTPRTQPKPSTPTEPADDISAALATRAIKTQIELAAKNVGERTAPFLPRVFRYCYAVAISPNEIMLGLGNTDTSTRSRINSACNALVKVNLLVTSDGRYQVNQAEVNRLRALSNLR